MTNDYDAIIVGASFAGLAVARRLRGRILLLDRHEVGAVQTSACGTPLWVPQAVGVEESVLQVHEKVVVHAPTGTVVFDVSDVPYCTFDYRKFCRGLQAQSDARFLRTAVRGLGNGAVETEAGRFVAPCIIDGSGWRGVLVRRPEADSPVSFGLETEAAYPGEALYFWAAPGRERDVISWIFPVGGASRVGVGSYAGESKLKAPLTDFMEDLGLRPTSFHGTYFPSGLRQPTVDTVFAVGDAAGQCLPLTAEGIRPALYFGDHCGRLVQAVIDGRLTLRAALAEYRRRALRYRHAYRALRWAQRAGSPCPADVARSDGRAGKPADDQESVVAAVRRVREARRNGPGRFAVCETFTPVRTEHMRWAAYWRCKLAQPNRLIAGDIAGSGATKHSAEAAR